MDAGFERVDRDIRGLRLEVGEMRSDLNGRIDGLNSTMIRIGGGMIAGMMVGFLSVIAAVLTAA